MTTDELIKFLNDYYSSIKHHIINDIIKEYKELLDNDKLLLYNEITNQFNREARVRIAIVMSEGFGISSLDALEFLEQINIKEFFNV